MKKTVSYSQKEFEALPKKIIDAIIMHTKEGWGCKFISRETEEELGELSIYGLLGDTIRKVLEEE